MMNENFTNDKTFCLFPTLEPSYWSLQNKQPIDIGTHVSPPNQPIGSLQNGKTHLRKKSYCLYLPKFWFTIGNEMFSENRTGSL